MLQAIVERFASRWTRFTTSPYAGLDALYLALGPRLGRPATLAEARFVQWNVGGIRNAMAADITPMGRPV